ncbi:response regulator [Candidatus Raskinella chloraquaticus]|uniref:DNA-binding response regulator n=1 Tax=Candidatus Raskinella chloraquaticus TaxID=1951219 RepID=A0A1W9HQ65_9HYPH|nr:MAG: DNA-binding response regulator [Proteobacteria bacterium SG_bin8]
MAHAYSIVIADDHPLFRGALRQALSGFDADLTIDEAAAFEDVTRLLAERSDVDLVLLDLAMPGIKGFSGLMYLRAQYPAVPVVVVSANEDHGVMRRCIDFGASGFIPKSLGADLMRHAIQHVLNGGIWLPPELGRGADNDQETATLINRLTTLTPQQVRVLMMLTEGLLNKQIAYELGVSEATVKTHVSAILQKLDVESRTQAVIAASRIDIAAWQAGNGTLPALS